MKHKEKTIEEFSKETGIPVEQLKKKRDAAKESMSNTKNPVLVPDFAMYYLNSVEFKLFTYVIGNTMYPANVSKNDWDNEYIGKITRTAPKKVNDARNNLIAMGLIYKVDKPIPKKVYSYCVNFNEINRINKLLLQLEPEQLPKLRKFFGLRHISEIRQENIDDFFPEELIDHKEIERIDKEERRKRRMLERAEQSVDRNYRELQYILLAEYQDKKLERQDTDTSLVHKSINEDINLNNEDNKENDNEFIFSNNLRLLPKVKTKENIRYKDINKEEDNRRKTTYRNFNINTMSAPKIKIKTSRMSINAKNIENKINMTTSKIKTNYIERNNSKSIYNRLKNIRPMNLRDKLIINAKNKIK